MTPDAQLAALKDLVESDGWKLYLAHVAEAWGPEAFERALDQALDGADPADETAVTRRMRDTFKGVRADVTWPETTIAVLSKPKASVVDDVFARFRRA